MELDTIASLGGSFYVSPTIIFSSNAQVAITAISGTTVTAAFIDSSSINTDTIGGVQWTNYSKIKISGRLGDVILGNNGNTCSGTLTAKMNTTAGRINCTFTCDQASSLSVKTYAASEVHDLRVMIYEKGVNSTTSYPVGILLTGYGTNNNSYIDMYQGEDTRTKPRVRLGKLDGLDASIKVGDVAPTGFGLYADNVFLKGTIHSTAGIIGGWTISDGKLYHTANTPGSNSSILAPGGVSSTVDIAGSGTSSHSWAFTIKNIFGVTTAGDLYSSSGKIGGWTIGPTSLVNGTWGTSGSAMMCTGTSGSKQIGGSTSISGWTFSSGANFGVTSSGALYCSDAHVQGEITATSGTIGGCSITNGVLQVASANIGSIDASKITSGTISADRIGAGTISADKLSATAIVVGGRNILHGTDAMNLGSGGWPVGQFAQSASTINTSLFSIAIDNAPVPNIKKGIKLLATSSQTSPGYGQGKYPMYGHIGDVLTYSAWVKCSKANQVVRLQAFSDGTSGISETSSKDFTIATANKWTHISYTTAAIQYDHSTMTIGYVYLRNGAANDTVEVCGQMLEWGNRASDWTPSPDEIGGLAIDATSIHTANVAVTSNADNSIALSSADFQRTINGTARSGLRLAIGDKFGVTGDGKIYASDVDLTGEITATSGTIGGCSITNGVLNVPAANITGTLTASQINTSEITIGQSQVTNLSDDLNKALAQYGTCSTAGSEQIKVVSCPGFQLYEGALIGVKFSKLNSYAGSQLKLNINNTGEIVVACDGQDTSSGNLVLWTDNTYVQFRYTGSKYEVVGDAGTYYNNAYECSTAAATASKYIDSFNGIVIRKGTVVIVKMKYNNTASSPKLSLSGTGARDIYAGTGTTRPLESNGLSWIAGSTVEFIFDGLYWRTGDVSSLQRAYSASQTATNYITTVTDAGIKVHDANNTTDYIQIKSDGSYIYKGGSLVSSFGTDITLGQTSDTNRNIFIDSDSGVSIRKGTTTLANYGDTITLYHGTSGKAALTIDSTNGLKFYKTDGSTVSAQLNSNGLILNNGFIGGTSGWNITSNKLYNGTIGANESMFLGTADLGSASIAGYSRNDWRMTVGGNFGVTNTGTMYCNDAVISGAVNATSGSIGPLSVDNVSAYFTRQFHVTGGAWHYYDSNGSILITTDSTSYNYDIEYKFIISNSYTVNNEFWTNNWSTITTSYYNPIISVNYTLDSNNNTFDTNATSFCICTDGTLLTDSSIFSSQPIYIGGKNNHKQTILDGDYGLIQGNLTIPQSYQSITVGNTLTSNTCMIYGPYGFSALEDLSGSTSYSSEPADTVTGRIWGCVYSNANKDSGLTLIKRWRGSNNNIITKPTIKLTNIGNVYAAKTFYSNGTALTSDERKKNIINMPDINITKQLYMNIKPIMFKWKSDHVENDNRYHFGIGAQTTQNIINEFGFSNLSIIEEQNDQLYANYTELQMLTIPVVQDHEYRIRKLEKENEYLREKIKLLTKEEV